MKKWCVNKVFIAKLGLKTWQIPTKMLNVYLQISTFQKVHNKNSSSQKWKILCQSLNKTSINKMSHAMTHSDR